MYNKHHLILNPYVDVKNKILHYIVVFRYALCRVLKAIKTIEWL